MKVMIFGPFELSERLRNHFESLGHAVSETTSDAQEALNMVSKSKSHLLLLDPNLSFQTAVDAAQEGRESFGKTVAFISPDDDIVRDVLLDLRPVGFLPSRPELGDVASLVAAVRAEREENSAKKHPSASGDPSRGSLLRIVATLSMLLAITVGYFLPNELPALEGVGGYTAYFVVVLLALLSIGCLLSMKLQIRAVLYAAAIALVTVLPTQQ